MNDPGTNRVSVTVNPVFWDHFVASLVMIRYAGAYLILHAVFPLAGVFVVWFPIYEGAAPNAAVLLVAAPLFFFTPLILAFSVWRARKARLHQGPFTHAFDAEGVHTSGAAFTQTIKWQAIPRVRRSKRFLFFFISTIRALAIPVKAIRNEAVLDDICRIAAEHTDFR